MGCHWHHESASVEFQPNRFYILVPMVYLSFKAILSREWLFYKDSNWPLIWANVEGLTRPGLILYFKAPDRWPLTVESGRDYEVLSQLGFRCATCRTFVIFHSFMNKCGFGFGLILLWLIRALSNVVIIARRFVNWNILICDWIYKKLKWPLCLWSAFETVDDRDY
jgi:hypothetical protein